MLTLVESTLDFSLSTSCSMQLSGFTLVSGSFSEGRNFRLRLTDTPQNSDPFSFTKLYANAVTGPLNLTIDLTNVTTIGSCSPTTLTPKGFFILPRYDSNATTGVVLFKKADTNGYTGCYNLLTNEYRLGLNYLPLVLLGEVGSTPSTNNRLLSLTTVSGQEPENTYIIIWGD